MTSEDKFDDFVSLFNERVQEAKLGEPDSDEVVPIRPRELAIADVFIGDLIDNGQLGDIEQIFFDKRVGRHRCRLHGYALREEDDQVDLLVAIPAQSTIGRLDSVGKTAVESAVRQAAHIFRYATDEISKEMEPSSEALDMVRALASVSESTRRLRVIVLTDGKFGKIPTKVKADNLPPIDLDLWDLERLYRATSAGQTYESFEIDLEQLLGGPLKCLRAPSTAADHRCYLAILPGKLLHDLYHEHGPRLLELNVRSFLQARGKVNRGIRDTLNKNSGYFLAYNNGLSVTVEELDLTDEKSDCLSIRKLKGLQIVNGGQTIASIHRAGNREKIDLTNIYVQAKITHIAPDDVDTLVPHISRYSNTQNKVQETDFSANHPFHVRIQQLSRSVWAPGETSRWFYERARGQWEVARVREGATPARRRAFDQREPRKQKFDKTLLAKAVNVWDQKPHIVGRGGQKNFIEFMKSIESYGKIWEPDETYYKHLVAKIINLKQAESIARQIGFSAYRANAVAYTAALLSYRTSGRIDLSEIWIRQSVSESMAETLRLWMPQVHEEIVESSAGKNVTEWCKRIDCWSHIQTMDLKLPEKLQNELAEGLPLPNVGQYSESKGSTPRSLTNEERGRQALTMKYSFAEWAEILQYTAKSGEFNSFELGICSTVSGYALNGWKKVPSPKQTKYTIRAIELWQESLKASEVEDRDRG